MGQTADDDKKEEEEEGEKFVRSQNVKFYEVLVNGWPRVFAVAMKDIEPGQELLSDYGPDFWCNFRAMIKRQRQLDEIKQRVRKEVNDEWQQKYDKLKAEF